MSIIERAIGKLQGGTAPEPKSPPLIGGARRQREPIVSVTDAARPRREPRASIEIDLKDLASQGVTSPADLTDRLQEQMRRIKRPVLETVAEHAAAASGAAGASSSTPSNLLMITSSVAAEGKTYIAFNLALSIARERDYSVLIVDADVAKRHLSEALKADQCAGITDSVADEALDPEDLVLGTGIPGLTFLPAGRQTSVAPELFSSQRMAQVVRRLGQADPQRIIVFDSAPLLATSEAPVLSRLVDQIILVICAESTQQPVVLEAIGLLEKAKTIRCVLNQSRVSSLTEHYYGYGYYPHERPTAP